MRGLVRKLFSRSRPSEADSLDSNLAGNEDPSTFDMRMMKGDGVPVYPLDQVLKNQAEILSDSAVEISSSTAEDEETSGMEVVARKPDVWPPVRYVDDGAIGEGGTAVVYRAIDTRLKRKVALKRFKNNHDGQNEDYLAELESVSRLRHPNVVSTFDADADEKGSFIVMELIDGIDAEEMITRERRTFNVSQFTDFAIQALEGLHATHEGGLLHLDLKPSNIMIAGQVSGRGIVKIVDYGRATLIRDSEGNPPKGRGLDGSIYYASPEQLREEILDERADLYALGCVFYWVLCAKMPYVGKSTIQVMSSHLQHIVVPLADVEPGLPKWLCDWVMWLISLRKEDRPMSAQEAIDELLHGGQGHKITRLSR